MKLKSMHLEFFKGVNDATYNFFDKTSIDGTNRLGKTTVATAWYWLMCGRSYELVSNPNIRPDNVEERKLRFVKCRKRAFQNRMQTEK